MHCALVRPSNQCNLSPESHLKSRVLFLTFSVGTFPPAFQPSWLRGGFWKKIRRLMQRLATSLSGMIDVPELGADPYPYSTPLEHLAKGRKILGLSNFIKAGFCCWSLTIQSCKAQADMQPCVQCHSCKAPGTPATVEAKHAKCLGECDEMKFQFADRNCPSRRRKRCTR